MHASGSFLKYGLYAALFVGAATTYGFYRHDLKVARANAVAGSAMLRTACGEVEYAAKGSGVPVLSVHGTGGGWDQGLSMTGDLAQRGFRVIAPSRYGYLRTAMPREHPTPQMEADLFVCILDALGIDRVGVIAASAGATPALQFALRHPERVSSLVLLVPAIGGIGQPDTVGTVPGYIMNVVLASDFPYWAAMKVWPRAGHTITAVPEDLVTTLAPADRRRLDAVIAEIMPVSRRRKGILYDAHNQSTEPPYPLAMVGVPTLLISAADDLYRTLPNARVAAAKIPGARLIAFETGGHLLLGHDAEVWPAVAQFLK